MFWLCGLAIWHRWINAVVRGWGENGAEPKITWLAYGALFLALSLELLEAVFLNMGVRTPSGFAR